MFYEDLKDLAETKLRESKALLDAGFPDGAYYLAGYVIELALKARICKILQWDTYPHQDIKEINKEFKTHKLYQLILLAGLSKDLENKKLNDKFSENWSLIADWNESMRYKKSTGKTRDEEVKNTIFAIEDSQNGIFTWLKNTW